MGCPPLDLFRMKLPLYPMKLHWPINTYTIRCLFVRQPGRKTMKLDFIENFDQQRIALTYYTARIPDDCLLKDKILSITGRCEAGLRVWTVAEGVSKCLWSFISYYLRNSPLNPSIFLDSHRLQFCNQLNILQNGITFEFIQIGYASKAHMA